jgi:hypothetical protein
MRRSKQEITYWNDKIRAMLKEVPDSGLTKNRFRAIRYLLVARFKEQKFTDEQKTLQMISDIEYVSRKMRHWTKGLEKELKEQLEEEFISDDLNYQIGV